MVAKPLVGINTDFRKGQGKQPSHAVVTAGYFDRIARAGGIPVLVPPLESELDLEQLLNNLDAFVLIGGNDYDPRRDGFMVHPSMKLMDPRRETFDRILVEAISRRRMPLLAIGAGLQLLNVTHKGNLFYNIPDDLPEALPHRDSHDNAHRHGLVVEPGSLMDKVYGDGEIRVNSRHHIAIDEIAPGFRVTARCGDGVVEAIESTEEDWLVIGTQFHPESDAASALDLRIFELFLEGIQEQRSAGVVSVPALRVVA
jgi:putative glutamine amidotransferase